MPLTTMPEPTEFYDDIMIDCVWYALSCDRNASNIRLRSHTTDAIYTLDNFCEQDRSKIVDHCHAMIECDR